MHPSFSIVIPTRDRPELVGFALQSVALQTCRDFEVIVCDNAVQRPCREVFEQHADARFRYVSPPSALSMADNWEFACQQARGDYVTVLIDKTVLFPSALQLASDAIAGAGADVVSWWNECYQLQHEHAGDVQRGCYVPQFHPSGRGVVEIDPRAELARRFSLDVRRGAEGPNYFYGKICFGAYSRALIERIRARVGRLFYPISPDYTSMLAALSMADRVLDLGRPGLMSINSSVISNGARFARDAAYTATFVSSMGAEYGPANWPLPGLGTSQHNCVAFDYAHMKSRLHGLIAADINMANLMIRCKEDLDAIEVWADEAVRAQQYQIWAANLRTLPPERQEYVGRRTFAKPLLERVRSALGRQAIAVKSGLSRVPGAASAYRTAVGKPPVTAKNFDNVIDAVRCAEERYVGTGNAPRAVQI